MTDQKTIAFGEYLKNNYLVGDRWSDPYWYKTGDFVGKTTEEVFKEFKENVQETNVRDEPAAINQLFEDILNCVTDLYEVSPKIIISENRGRRRISDIRHLFCLLAKELTDAYLEEIGYFLSDRDHTTVIHSIARAKELLDIDEHFRHKYEESKRLILGKIPEGGKEIKFKRTTKVA